MPESKFEAQQPGASDPHLLMWNFVAELIDFRATLDTARGAAGCLTVYSLDTSRGMEEIPTMYPGPQEKVWARRFQISRLRPHADHRKRGAHLYRRFVRDVWEAGTARKAGKFAVILGVDLAAGVPIARHRRHLATTMAYIAYGYLGTLAVLMPVLISLDLIRGGYLLVAKARHEPDAERRKFLSRGIATARPLVRQCECRGHECGPRPANTSRVRFRSEPPAGAQGISDRPIERCSHRGHTQGDFMGRSSTGSMRFHRYGGGDR